MLWKWAMFEKGVSKDIRHFGSIEKGVSKDIRHSGSIADNALEETVLNLFAKWKAPVNPSNVEDCHRLKSTNNTLQKVIAKLSKRKDVYRVLKAKSSLKNADLNGTGIPPGTPIFVNQSLCRYHKFLWSKCKKFWLNKVVEPFLGIKRLVSNKVAWQISQGYNPYRRFENTIPWKPNLGRKFR